MKTKTLIFLLVIQLSVISAAFAGQTIVAHETEGYFYSDGKMDKEEGRFENTYYLEGDTITRTRVYDYKKKEIIPDNTVYKIQSQLTSHPGNPLNMPSAPQVIRAVGQPGLDAIETLVIDDNFIQSCKSTSNYFVISRFKRIK